MLRLPACVHACVCVHSYHLFVFVYSSCFVRDWLIKYNATLFLVYFNGRTLSVAAYAYIAMNIWSKNYQIVSATINNVYFIYGCAQAARGYLVRNLFIIIFSYSNYIWHQLLKTWELADLFILFLITASNVLNTIYFWQISFLLHPVFSCLVWFSSVWSFVFDFCASCSHWNLCRNQSFFLYNVV